MPRILQVLSVFVLAFFVCGASASAAPQATSEASQASPTIVIGFVGGFVQRTNRVHSTVQVAEHLREEFPAGVDVEVFENHRGKEAYQKVLELLDTDRDGTLSPAEKQSARIIIYGHSWGASETVNLARQLDKEGIPVLLTVQVDSITKAGENDALIPANVAQAANFYQSKGLLHGTAEIRSVDPARTHILGNFRSDYSTSPLRCEEYPWFSRTFNKPHIQIECDPAVWNRVESLIRANLFPAPENASARGLISNDPSVTNSVPPKR